MEGGVKTSSGAELHIPRINLGRTKAVPAPAGSLRRADGIISITNLMKFERRGQAEKAGLPQSNCAMRVAYAAVSQSKTTDVPLNK